LARDGTLPVDSLLAAGMLTIVAHARCALNGVRRSPMLKIEVERETTGVASRVVDLPGAFAYGKTQEAIERVQAYPCACWPTGWSTAKACRRLARLRRGAMSAWQRKAGGC